MPSRLSNKIKTEAASLGFFACGIARAEAVEEPVAHEVRQWVASEKYAGMSYMANYTDMRLDPRLLMPGVKSIISVALNYTPAKHIPHEEYQFAAYAYGKDYHEVVKQKLRELAARLGFTPLLPTDNSQKQPHSINNTGQATVDDTTVHYRAFCDSAPVLERYWAMKAGLGWLGRHHQLIIPRAGSMVFLAELFVDIELDYDQPMKNRCGTCRKCVEACPTGALGDLHIGQNELSPFLSHLCISYQTVENKGDIPHEIGRAMGNGIYGCDRCQQACPWSKTALPGTIDELQPSERLLSMTREQWNALSENDYRELFKHSAVKRAKYSGLMRNIHAAEENLQDANSNGAEET